MKKTALITALLALALTTFGQGYTIADTYWRNEQTGDWLIGFADGHLIYNNKVWEIASQTEKKDAYTLTTDNGDVIKVGKAKNGLRAITIGNGKPTVCSQITTATLPDYPTKDLTSFKDNDYRMGDTATIVGWLKDCPKDVLDQNREFNISTRSLFDTSKEIKASGTIDALGRFVVKMPVENTQQVFMDWKRTTLATALEPGETYFYLHDYKTGQQLMMGSNVRVQNELIAHHIDQETAQLWSYGMTAEEAIDYENRWAIAYEHNNARLDSVLTQHPTLSRRFEDYQRMYYLSQMGYNLMQARYYTRGWKMPAEVADYVSEQLRQSVRTPYTMIRDFNILLKDYQEDAEMGSDMMQRQSYSPATLRRMEKDGLVSLSQQDHELTDRWEQRLADFYAVSMLEADGLIRSGKYSSVMASEGSLTSREDILAAYNAHYDRFAAKMAVADSLFAANAQLRDIAKAQLLCQRMDWRRTSLTDSHLAFADEIQMPEVRQRVLSINDMYVGFQQQDISKEQSLKANDDVADMSDGEQILRKITEPYRGRLILLDVWGTWCTPCKEALSHSKEEFERLKDYNLVYLYLANNSSDKAWKNVIKEYDLVGEDIIHYNLPATQQHAVERFLNVQGFPTYKLIDRDGTVLDVNADPRNLESLARLLEKLK